MSLPAPDKRFVAGRGMVMVYAMACHSCGEEFLVDTPSNLKGGWSGDQSQEVGTRRVLHALKAAGWTWKSDFRRCTCPKCQPKEVKMPTPKAEAPKSMTREARRKIADLLETVYDVDEGRYQKAESDATVAAALDMPRAWVTEVRGMLFGEHDRNEQSAAFLAELGAVEAKIADVARSISEHQQAITQIQDEIRRLRERRA